MSVSLVCLKMHTSNAFYCKARIYCKIYLSVLIELRSNPDYPNYLWSIIVSVFCIKSHHDD